MRSLLVLGRSVLLVGACAENPPGSTPPAAPTAQVTPSDFDPADFDPSSPVDNRWFPLTPGTELVYEGQALDDGEIIDRR